MSWAGWRKVERDFWWCPDFGTAVKKDDGWYASRSGYSHVFVEPVVGPFKTHKLAIAAYEKAMKKRRASAKSRAKSKARRGPKVSGPSVAELREWHDRQQDLDDALNRCNAQRVIRTSRGSYYSQGCERHQMCREIMAEKARVGT
jgi:hypothetical protein